MIRPIRAFLGICIILLGLNSTVGAAESAPPSILSPNLSSVNYVDKSEHNWVLIIADELKVLKVWIDGKTQDIEPQSTVIINKKLHFQKGKNIITVEAKNAQGIDTQRVFTVYYDEDPKKLEELKNANLPPEERPVAMFARVAGGKRLDSNAPHLPAGLSPGLDKQKAAVTSGELVLGYRVKPKNTSRTFQLQYSYLTEAYEDKEINESELKDLGLRSHTISGQYTWRQQQQAWNVIYAWSKFFGNAKTDSDDNSTTDNGNIASFHFLVPTYTRVHNESLSSMLLLKFISRNFEEEPDDSDHDRDSQLSVGADYNLFYYLPSKQGRLQGMANVYSDQAEGKAQRFAQKGLGVSYEKNWNLSDLNSELQWNMGTQGRLTDYQEKYMLTAEASSDTETEDAKNRRTLRQTDYTSLTWAYQSSLKIRAGYSHTRAFSSIDEFTFDSEVRSLDLSWETFF
ncbi:MAG: hypothetical protein HQM14_08360 [SAR324 cluster bacterium]|nr:hypothetical protein [SAR324 cluster bacterium]